MTTKSNILKSAFIAASIGAGLVTAYAVQPAKTPIELEEPQVNIAAQQYEVESISCRQMCFAKVKADEYDIFVEFRFDDASVDGTNILNVVRFDETVNAHIDYYEIVKINAAIAGGVK